MSCLIDAGRSRGCKGITSGLYSIFISNYPQNVTTSLDFLTKDADGTVTSLSGTTTGLTLYEFTPEKGSSSFEENYNAAIEFGSVSYEQKCTLVMAGMSQEMQNQVKSLLAGNFIVVVKLKANGGTFFLMGESDSAGISGGSAQSGKAVGELSGYSIELMAIEGSPSPEVEAAAVAAAISA